MHGLLELGALATSVTQRASSAIRASLSPFEVTFDAEAVERAREVRMRADDPARVLFD